MKILHVLYSGLGGHGNVFFSMIDADKDHDFEYEALFNGIEDVRPEYKKKCIQFGLEWTNVKKKEGLDLGYLKKFFTTIKKSNAEIVLLHSSMYLLPALLANVFSKQKKKILIRETQANNLKNRKEWIWLSLAFLFANKIIFLSEEYKNEIKKRLRRFYNKKKVVVIPNGIDLAKFKKSQNSNINTTVIGMQSRLAPNKDHITLLQSFALLKEQENDLTLKIAGDGSCMAELKLLAQELHIENEVQFLGMLEENELINFLQNLDIYVHASFGETMSTAIMQAMGCGLPIIASDVPGISNMIIDKTTGILVPTKNKELMAEAMLGLLNNKPAAKALGENAFAFAKTNYSNAIMFTKYKEVFDS